MVRKYNVFGVASNIPFLRMHTPLFAHAALVLTLLAGWYLLGSFDSVMTHDILGMLDNRKHCLSKLRVHRPRWW
jgi:hypothetical protein